MDLDYLQQVTGQAGYRIDWTALTGLSARHPEPVLDWIAAAADHAAAHTGHRLLTATATALRDRVAGTQPGHLYQYADQLAEVCDLLTQTAQARGEAIDHLSACCADLAALDPAALTHDPDAPAPPAPSYPQPVPPPLPRPDPAHATVCHGLRAHPHRRPRRRPPTSTVT